MVRLAADGEEGVALLAEGVAQRGGAAEELVEEAALEALGLSRQALYRKMERLGIVLERRPKE